MRYRACAFLVLGMLFCSSASAETVDKIVANVNGDIILYSELKDRIKSLEKENPEIKTDDPARQKIVEQEVLRLIIRDRLTEQEISRLKINVSDKDVESAVENVKRESQLTDSQFEYLLQQEGQTLAQFKENMKKRLERNRLVDRVLKSRTIITDDQVDKFLKSEDVPGPDRRRLAVLFIPVSESDSAKVVASEQKAKDIHDKLKSGADFARAVREHSRGPAVQDGGDIGFMDAGDLAKPIEIATRNLGVGEVTEVIKTPGGFYIFKVLDLQRERAASTDPDAREKARRMLLQKELDRKFMEWIEELEGRAFIQISL